MDGLSIKNSDLMVKTGRTTSELRNRHMNEDAGAVNGGKSFADTLKDAVGTVNQLSQEAGVLQQKLATGETKNIPEVLIAAEKSGVAFKLLMQVRNKVIDAYQEIMKMQV
jgi:flagellar hook-basal body complex protein FliE